MSKGITIKHVRKAGAFVNGELSAGETGLDVTNGTWYFSRNGTTVEQMGGGVGDMTKAEFASNGATGKVDKSVDSDKLGGTVAGSYALKTYADNAATSAVANVINSAPAALDTLNELASALGNDANFSTTITNALAGKAATSHQHAGTDLTSGDIPTARMQTNVAAALQAGSGTISNASLTLDGGSI
jgi:hypothetical protein